MAVICPTDPGYYPLTRLSPMIMERFGESPSYAMLYHRACSGRLPQIKYSGNRLYFHEDDVPDIARAFGIRTKVSEKTEAA